MTAFFFKGVPDFRMNDFCAVRDNLDNLENILQLAEMVNTCGHCKISDYEDDFDFVIFSGDYCRALIRKSDGYFSMTIPFQIVDDGSRVYFNYDLIAEEVSGIFISILRNAILTCQGGVHSHEEIICSLVDSFGLSVTEAIPYYDAFATLLMDDHGYFRFDDDPKNENGNIHPRYHFDFFFKNTSSIKIGLDAPVNIECFYSLFDGTVPKHYLRT
ncbi:hypothetical protein NLO74_01770 [Pseudomonas tremae]|uniref:hypothetical protein n=1 Tax=Pseudomonas tremae TaxID=200454 RepID=UPI00210A9886|nr:hypothetical protein [Pseudomonas tremae]MCQ3024743.1 hypothetical protein [Pseudomonas tremae]